MDAIDQVEQPGAVPLNLEDEPPAVRRYRRGPEQVPLARGRKQALGGVAGRSDDQASFVAVSDPVAVGEPGGPPRLTTRHGT